MQNTPSPTSRYLVTFFILLLSFSLFYKLSLNLTGYFHVRKAEENIFSERFFQAAEHFQKAGRYLPDNHRINTGQGETFYRLGVLSPKKDERVSLFEKSEMFFTRALELNPLDARSAYGLARAAIRFEELYEVAGKEIRDKPMRALAYLEKAIELRPASVVYRRALARYLYQHNEKERLLSQIYTIALLQPSYLNQMRQEPFWNHTARISFEKGVEEALASGTTPRQSLFALSDIMAEKRNWQAAVSYQSRGMTVQESLNSSGDYIRLGYLSLKTDQESRALDHFFQALAISRNIEADMITVMRNCNEAGDPQTLLEFYHEAAARYGTSHTVDISAARNLIDLHEKAQARKILTDATDRKPDSEAYYLLSQITERDLNFDEAELYIQKAAMHDPRNSSYHLAFSRLLNRLQKYERAEKEAGLAIEHADNVSAGLYSYRASLRMRMENYAGALEDLQNAVKIDPGNSSYQQQIERIENEVKRER